MWMKNSLDPDLMKPVDLGPCTVFRLQHFENLYKQCAYLVEYCNIVILSMHIKIKCIHVCNAFYG